MSTAKLTKQLVAAGQAVSLILLAIVCRAAGAADKRTQYSAICTVARDENRYVREWVEYHRCLGISKIYLLDHNSSVPMSNEVQDYVQQGLVEYIPFTGVHTKFKTGFSSNLERFMTTIQGQAYKMCLERYGSQHQWMGFIDIDEFLVLLSKEEDKGRMEPTTSIINAFLSRYAGYGGVSLYWVLLGTSGHQQRPDAWVTRAYTACIAMDDPGNTQFKTFVNTDYKPLMYSPHRARFELNVSQLPQDSATAMAVATAATGSRQQLQSLDSSGHHNSSSSSNPGHHSRVSPGQQQQEKAGGATAAELPGPYLVNEQAQRIPAGRNKRSSHQHMAVFHYATKSSADFMAKLSRGGGAGVTRPRNYHKWLDARCTQTCHQAIHTYERACAGNGTSPRTPVLQT